MAILTQSGRAALAIAVAAQNLHLAWGTGDPVWDATPAPEPVEATGLVSEVGRRGPPQLLYVAPNAAGAISLPSGRWAVSAEPTNHLYMRFAFDYADGAAATIRELGVFVGTVVKGDVLAAQPGRQYFEPAMIERSGTLLALQRTPRIIRSGQTRQAFEFVLTL